MITSVRLVNFKNFADETLKVGPFTVIVGANASGKSNIRDAFRFLHGIGRGYTLAEIMGGRYGEGGYLEWPGIRGAPMEIARFGQDDFTLELESKPTPESESNFSRIKYSIRVKRNYGIGTGFYVANESLSADSNVLYIAGPPPSAAGGNQQDDSTLHVYLPTHGATIDEFRSDQPVLDKLIPHLLDSISSGRLTFETQMARTLQCSIDVGRQLLGIRFLELSPHLMREPTFPDMTYLGINGENLPAVLREICEDSTRKNVLTTWLRELTPTDVKDLLFPADPSGRVHLYLQEGSGFPVSANSASDGTLRFLGMLAALLSPNPAGLYFFEEIDNGIHPNRLWLLLDLIERQTANGKVQVITSTHSPEVLNFMNDTTFEDTSVVYRDEKSTDAIIRPIVELPNARELRRSQGLGRLHSGGWIETALAFTEGGYGEDSEDKE